MKFRLILTLAMLSISFLLLSCITSREIHVDITCDQFSANPHAMNEFKAAVGDKIYVKLCSNQTTGFEWNYEISTENVLKLEDHDFEEPENTGVVGAAGKEVWTFEATDTGTTEVTLEYSQPWEGGEKEEWTYTMTVTVE